MEEQSLLGIPRIETYLVLGIVMVFVLLEVIADNWRRSQRTWNDWIQEVGAFVMLGGVVKPGIVLLVLMVGDIALPSLQYILSDVSFWIMLVVFVLGDDFLQYWYHRIAHETPFLWKLHRPHHQAEEMGFFVSYRNALTYYLLMPNIWFIAIFTFIGGAYAAVIGLVLKQVVVISSHSTVRYDAWLYRQSWAGPLVRVLERIIVTPAFHHAHHGRSKADGISDPNGNFGNMLSIWDQVFGTAVFTRRFPVEYGLPKNTPDHWTATFLYPLVHSSIPESDLNRGFSKPSTASPEPAQVELKAGRNYLWCVCGMSGNQPFCDGSHHGTKHRPLLFTVKRDKEVRLCNCKLTKAGPFCDNAHVNWKGQ